MATTTDEKQDAVDRLWTAAWGQSWPHQSQGRISLAEVGSLSSSVPALDEDPLLSTESDSGTDSHDAVDSRTPTEWEYVCLRNIQSVARPFGGAAGIQDVLVVRREYVWLRETMESGYLKDSPAMVVTGQPGIGS